MSIWKTNFKSQNEQPRQPPRAPAGPPAEVMVRLISEILADQGASVDEKVRRVRAVLD